MAVDGQWQRLWQSGCGSAAGCVYPLLFVPRLIVAVAMAVAVVEAVQWQCSGNARGWERGEKGGWGRDGVGRTLCKKRDAKYTNTARTSASKYI